MAKHWSLALRFRERRQINRTNENEPHVVIDKKLLEMIGVTNHEEVLCVVNNNGSLTITKVE